MKTDKIGLELAKKEWEQACDEAREHYVKASLNAKINKGIQKLAEKELAKFPKV